MKSSRVKTAIFPVAGLGTRFLPATKATPKELLPVLDTPLIQFAIDEALAAGVERLVFVSHPSKPAIESYVRHDPVLAATLRKRGKEADAEMLEKLCVQGDDRIIFCNQNEPLGLGHAVACASPYVLPGPVAVILPDDLILGQPGCVGEMIAAYEASGAGHLVAVMDVPLEEVSRYGVLNVVKREGQISHANMMVEKPSMADAPSRTAVVGRYVLDASVFVELESQAPGAGGEIQLTDAIARGAARVGLAGFHFSGERFDCGSKAGMLAAALRVAGQDSQYRGTLQNALTSLANAPKIQIVAAE